MLLRSRAILALLVALPAPALAQTRALPPLSFLGFEAGASLTAIREQVQTLGGRGLACKRATRDRAVQECRATVVDPGTRRTVNLWLSAMDSAAGILTLSTPLNGVELDGWRSGLETAFGTVDANVQGPQWMLQWVRQGRMLRLTWRIDHGDKEASVSLVDGQVLDGWGRRHEARAARTGRAGPSADRAQPPSP
jgi:hypothetical protein